MYDYVMYENTYFCEGIWHTGERYEDDKILL